MLEAIIIQKMGSIGRANGIAGGSEQKFSIRRTPVFHDDDDDDSMRSASDSYNAQEVKRRRGRRCTAKKEELIWS